MVQLTCRSSFLVTKNMPFITSLGSPYSTLKLRPLDNSRLKPKEIIKVPKGQKLGVVFPHSDEDQKIQAVRLVARATDLGLTAGETWYCFINDWLVNGVFWKQQSKKSILVTKNPEDIPTSYVPQMKPGDYWLKVFDFEYKELSSMVCLDSSGKQLWNKECLAKGQISDWSVFSGDTPVGLYKLGQLWIADKTDITTLLPYGEYCYDMISVVDGEEAVGRSGICYHGGGSNLGFPGCVQPHQKLLPTFGCIRGYNHDLATVIYDLWKKTQDSCNTIWITVIQL